MEAIRNSLPKLYLLSEDHQSLNANPTFTDNFNDSILSANNYDKCGNMVIFIYLHNTNYDDFRKQITYFYYHLNNLFYRAPVTNASDSDATDSDETDSDAPDRDETDTVTVTVTDATVTDSDATAAIYNYSNARISSAIDVAIAKLNAIDSTPSLSFDIQVLSTHYCDLFTKTFSIIDIAIQESINLRNQAEKEKDKSIKDIMIQSSNHLARVAEKALNKVRVKVPNKLDIIKNALVSSRSDLQYAREALYETISDDDLNFARDRVTRKEEHYRQLDAAYNTFKLDSLKRTKIIFLADMTMDYLYTTNRDVRDVPISDLLRREDIRTNNINNNSIVKVLNLIESDINLNLDGVNIITPHIDIFLSNCSIFIPHFNHVVLNVPDTTSVDPTSFATVVVPSASVPNLADDASPALDATQLAAETCGIRGNIILSTDIRSIGIGYKRFFALSYAMQNRYQKLVQIDGTTLLCSIVGNYSESAHLLDYYPSMISALKDAKFNPIISGRLKYRLQDIDIWTRLITTGINDNNKKKSAHIITKNIGYYLQLLLIGFCATDDDSQNVCMVGPSRAGGGGGNQNQCTYKCNLSKFSMIDVNRLMRINPTIHYNPNFNQLGSEDMAFNYSICQGGNKLANEPCSKRIVTTCISQMFRLTVNRQIRNFSGESSLTYLEFFRDYNLTVTSFDNVLIPIIRDLLLGKPKKHLGLLTTFSDGVRNYINQYITDITPYSYTNMRDLLRLIMEAETPETGEHACWLLRQLHQGSITDKKFSKYNNKVWEICFFITIIATLFIVHSFRLSVGDSTVRLRIQNIDNINMMFRTIFDKNAEQFNQYTHKNIRDFTIIRGLINGIDRSDSGTRLVELDMKTENKLYRYIFDFLFKKQFTIPIVTDVKRYVGFTEEVPARVAVAAPAPRPPVSAHVPTAAPVPVPRRNILYDDQSGDEPPQKMRRKGPHDLYGGGLIENETNDVYEWLKDFPEFIQSAGNPEPCITEIFGDLGITATERFATVTRPFILSQELAKFRRALFGY